MASGRAKKSDEPVSLEQVLKSAGSDEQAAQLLGAMPHRTVQVDSRRPFREIGIARDEIIFVLRGILSKFKPDAAGGRQIVALCFPGEGIVPARRPAEYGIQAVVRSEVAIGKVSDFDQLLDQHPELRNFFWRFVQRDEAIGYEWLVNCGRRDSTARVAHLLCETAVRMHASNDHLQNPFTQQQIAEITGQTSVNVNRVLADLERQGLIRRNGRDIEFTDWAEIRRVASFQAAYLNI